MRRLVLAMLVASLCTMLAGPMAGAAVAAPDDDIPGSPLGTGTVSGSVQPGSDGADVFSLSLSAGQEVRTVCATKPGSTASGRLRMLAPATPSISAAAATPSSYVLAPDYLMSSGTFLYSVADFTYVAARAGTYYLWMAGTAGLLSYDLQGAPTSRPPITTADADDIPGVPLGLGTTTGVVDTLTDRDDLYRVRLFAGQPVEFRLVPAASDDTFGAAHIDLLTPGSTSIGSYSTYDSAVPYSADHSAYNKTVDEVGVISFVPNQTAVYHVYVEASSVISNFPYTLEVSGSAALPDDQPPDTPVFPDVGADHPYRTAIEGMYERELISGYGDGRFGPSDPVKRAQFAKMIVGTMDIDTYEGMYHPFTDLDAVNPPNDLYPHEYVAAAYDNGITQGLTATTFGPYVPISRAQVVTMIVRAVQRLRPGTLASPPAGYGTLGDFDTTHSPHMRTAEYNGLLDGLQGFGPGWDPWRTATRGECAQILWNVLQM